MIIFEKKTKYKYIIYSENCYVTLFFFSLLFRHTLNLTNKNWFVITKQQKIHFFFTFFVIWLCSIFFHFRMIALNSETSRFVCVLTNYSRMTKRRVRLKKVKLRITNAIHNLIYFVLVCIAQSWDQHTNTSNKISFLRMQIKYITQQKPLESIFN